MVLDRFQPSPKEVFTRLSLSCQIGAVEVAPTLALGLVAIPAGRGSLITAEEYVRKAIAAYSLAINEGKSWVVYSEDLEPDTNDLVLLHDVHHYGTKDMKLVFQPKLSLRDGLVNEAEALLRWDHPTLGPVSPAKFIPLLEKSGVIKNITRWVIEEAIAELEKCNKIDPCFSISVNIASSDLVDKELLTFITEEIDEKYRKNLCLEVTETGIIEDMAHAQEAIDRLHSAGVRCSIDDFGTGHSCLIYLSKFAISEVKLDRSFVYDILCSGRNAKIVASTIDLTHTLGHKVTAEGVEDIETLSALSGLGCDAVQGYVFAKPMGPVKLRNMVGKRYSTETLAEL